MPLLWLDQLVDIMKQHVEVGMRDAAMPQAGSGVCDTVMCVDRWSFQGGESMVTGPLPFNNVHHASQALH
eukprot:8313305-Karenia_brevis.AAC.1